MCNPSANYWPGKEKRPGENIDLTSRDGHRFQVHVSRPDGEPPFKTMLIIHDYFDPEAYYYDLADQYAAAGYLAVVPNLFPRQGPIPEQTHEEAGKRIQDVDDERVFEDVDVVLDHLRAEGLLGDLS